MYIITPIVRKQISKLTFPYLLLHNTPITKTITFPPSHSLTFNKCRAISLETSKRFIYVKQVMRRSPVKPCNDR